MAASVSERTITFESKLPKGSQRFLAHVIEHGFQAKLRTAADFVRHFPPAKIMSALADSPELRANILELTVGVRRKIALKKSAESAGQDLQIALDEDETDTDTIVELFKPDDRVRYLEAAAIWRYTAESKFWTTAVADPAYPAAKQHMVFLLERGLKDVLLKPRDIVEGIGIARLVEHLPAAELVVLLEEVLAKGRLGKPFDDGNVIETTTCMTLVEHVPLPLIWEGVIVKMAESVGYTSDDDALFDEIEAHPDADEAAVEHLIDALHPSGNTGAIPLAIDDGPGSQSDVRRPALRNPPPIQARADKN